MTSIPGRLSWAEPDRPPSVLPDARWETAREWSARKAGERIDDWSRAVLAGQPAGQRLRPVGRTGDRVPDGRGERLGGEPLVADGPWPGAEGGEPGGPEWLVADHRHAYGGDSGAEPGRRCARARVMDHRRHPGEEPVVRHLADNDRIVGRRVGFRQAPPAGLDHHPRPGPPARRGDQVA